MNFVVAILVAAFVALACLLVFRLVRYRGATGALFKSRILRTLGSVSVANNTSSKPISVKVHLLGNPQPGFIGVEFERFNGQSWQLSPLVLSHEEAAQLSKLLAAATAAA